MTKNSAYRLAKEAWPLAVAQVGGESAIARTLDIPVYQVYRAQTCPKAWIARIEQLSGVPREQLRPDLYR
jgi:hypothetical protein